MQADDESETSAVCEQCGTTYAEFRKSGAVGCANCCKAFHAPIERIFKRVQAGNQHSGRIPEGVRSGASIRMNIDRLKQRMQKAIQVSKEIRAGGEAQRRHSRAGRPARRARTADGHQTEPPEMIDARRGEA